MDMRVKRLAGNKVRLVFSFQKNEVEKSSVSEIRVLGNTVQTIQDVDLHKTVKIVFQKDSKGSPQRWLEITVDELMFQDDPQAPPPAANGVRAPCAPIRFGGPLRPPGQSHLRLHKTN